MYYIVEFTGDPAKEKCFYILLHLYRYSRVNGEQVALAILFTFSSEEKHLHFPAVADGDCSLHHSCAILRAELH
ncbi:hypothetical protein NQ318_006920 [Aromia moschata]|uniref:Uncharacterized protein n=1 Tax=Aromia moschata TaxID=1265417 RepID=A0AAV8YPA9_9CUCU|nr:hypothetical protein NQ318_006920 [Aromia moschata]